jgi:hypothetical protein
MVHPCRARVDTGGNPSFKMHACSSVQSTVTLCGLGGSAESLEVDVVAGFTSLCKTCFPPTREVAWTGENDNAGDRIEGRSD